MATPIKVRVAGVEYEVSTINELALFPLLRVFGTDIAPTDQNSKEYKKWQQKFLSRFADPINQASVAYSLRNIIPDLPESVVKYALYKEESGDRREDFVLNIGAMDLLALMTAISPLMEARTAEIEGRPPQKAKGFGETMEELKALERADIKKLKAHELAQQRAALQAQLADLAELETATEG